MNLAKIGMALAAAGLIGSAAAATAQDVPASMYKPAGQWSLDYGDDYCRLARNFTDGTNTLAVAFERIEPSANMRLILVGPDLKTYRSAEEIGWHFLPSDAERKARATYSQTGDGKRWYNLGPVTLAAATPPTPGSPPAPPALYSRTAEQATAKGISGLVLDTGLTTPVQVDTGDLGAPIAALQACADDLAKSWGLDPTALKSETAPAVPEGGGVGWLPQGTIAFTDFAKLGGGSNQVRLMVDASGKPTSCAIHWPTLDEATNDKICKALMDKARFTPAKDVSGQPMAGYWIGSPLFLGPPVPGGRR
jgi:hypothetical protein